MLSPPGEVSSFGANPSHNGQASEESVFGPLYEAWRTTLPRPAAQQLVSGGRIVVATHAADSQPEARAYGLEPRSGAIAWEQALGPAAVVPVAADSGVVVAATHDGTLRAISAADGKVLWNREVPVQEDEGFLTAPVADSGVAYVGSVSDSREYETLYAYALSTGMRLWASNVPLLGTAGVSLNGGAPALDGSRVFVADECGNAAAVRRSDGRILWEQIVEEDACYSGTAAMVSGSTVFAGRGLAYAATTGDPRPSLSFDPLAAGELLAYGVPDDGSLTAAPIDGGAGGWERPSGATYDPLLVGGTLYVVDGDRLRSFEPSSGHQLLSQPAGRLEIDSYNDAGLAAAAGALLVPGYSQLTALRPILRPTGRRIAFALSAFDVGVGEKVSFVSAVGPALREQRPVILEQIDVAPFGRFETIGRGPAQEDGTTYFSRGIARNTKVRVRVEGGDATTALIRAHPRYRIAIRRTSDTRGVVIVKVKKIPPSKIAGMRTFAYFGRASQQTFRKLGSARLEGGMRDAQAEIGFRLLRHVGKKDIVAICVRNFARAGWGRNVGLQKHCGENRVPYPKKKGGKGGNGGKNRVEAAGPDALIASGDRPAPVTGPPARRRAGEVAGVDR